jgi:DNA invertase Pin-like site-specific DNA recombinase
MATGSFVAYHRVSTQKQGKSGLGLEAQQQAVRSYLNGGDWRLVAEVVEVESGKRSDRPKLAEALRLCRLHGATLIIAKLDRLARNVAFVSALMEAGVEFTAVDFPQANRLTVHILAAVAEHEAKMISERTKAALQAAKARGKVLGGYRGVSPDKAAVEASVLIRQASAKARAADLAPVIAQLRAEGVTSLGSLAKALTERGIPTARGEAKWSPVQVSRVMSLFS